MALILSSRFAVVFFAGGVVPNPLDTRFQKVSGLSTSVETATVNEGGQNLHSHPLPRRGKTGSLRLERGFVVGSLLHAELHAAMSAFQFVPANVMVTLLDEQAAPIAAWMFFKAFPVSWATADLDASQDKVLIDTIELAYASMQVMRL